ncbi:MAG: glycosyl hydrolase family 95 catalytic domain-containing protein [Promethearchaeota archaeon]
MEDYLDQHDLVFSEIPTRWIDGLFLGNGDVGAMMWRPQNPRDERGVRLAFTLDKYDVWEERNSFRFGPEHTYSDLRALVESGKFDEARRKYESRYMGEDIYPTRLPLPRLELEFPARITSTRARLCLHRAEFEASVVSGSAEYRLAGFVHSGENLLVVRIETLDASAGSPTIRPRLTYDHLEAAAREKLHEWGYPEPSTGIHGLSPAGPEINYLHFESPEGAGFGGFFAAHALVPAGRTGEWLLLCLVLTDHDLPASGEDLPEPRGSLRTFLEFSRGAFASFLEGGYAGLFGEHAAWWREFWGKSFVSVPDNVVENLFYVELYKLACNSREGKYPCTLQGVWTTDGKMPPWAGDYHLDMNVQESYWPIYSTNHLELGEPLYRVFHGHLPKFRERCRAFFGFEGAWTRCSLSLGGNCLNGYYTSEFWPGNGAWLAHLFWWHWRYSMDEEFLENRAFPFLEQCFLLYYNLLEENEFGEYTIPLSNAPEYNENLPEAWGKNPNCDLQLLRWLCAAIRESLEVLGPGVAGDRELGEKVRDVVEKLVDYPVSFEGGLEVMEGVPLAFSHRHHSHLMGVYPLGVIARDDADLARGREKDGESEFLLSRSLNHVQEVGTWQWTGWSFPWMSAILSRAEVPFLAYWYLKEYFKYTRENTMHVNGSSYSNPEGVHLGSHFTYDPMTLEAGFCAAAAVAEMLLQSHGGLLRLFPATPASWQDATFHHLRAEGAFLVSAKLVGGHLACAEISSERGGTLRVRNDFKERVRVTLKREVPPLKRVVTPDTPVIEVTTRPGETCRFESESFAAANPDFEFGAREPASRMFAGGNFFGHRPLSRNPYHPS